MEKAIDLLIGISFIASMIVVLMGLFAVITNIPADEAEDILVPKFFRPTFCASFFLAALGLPFAIGSSRPAQQFILAAVFFSASFRSLRNPPLRWPVVAALTGISLLLEKGLLWVSGH